MRCVRVCSEIEGAHVWDVMGRGINCIIISDLNEPWGSSTCTRCGKCVQVCPTGALFDKSKIGSDPSQVSRFSALSEPDEGSAMSKLKLATVWLDGCSGCHMSFLDMDERLLELAEVVDVVYSPIVDTKEFPDEVDIALVEGAVASVDDEKKIKKIRDHSKMLVAMGDCAITGNVPSMRNPIGPEAILDRAYIENASAQPQIPCVVVPKLLEGGASHPRVCEGGCFSARLPALGRHISHRADRAGQRRAAGYFGADPLWSLTNWR